MAADSLKHIGSPRFEPLRACFDTSCSSPSVDNSFTGARRYGVLGSASYAVTGFDMITDSESTHGRPRMRATSPVL